VAGVAVGDFTAARVEDADERGHEVLGSDGLEHDPIGPLRDLPGTRQFRRDGMEAGPKARHDDRGRHTLAGDIRDGEGDEPPAHREVVEIVAAYLQRREVDAADSEPADGQRALGREKVLYGPRDAQLLLHLALDASLLVELGAFDGDRGLERKRFQKPHVPRRIRPDAVALEVEQPDDVAVDDHRHHHLCAGLRPRVHVVAVLAHVVDDDSPLAFGREPNEALVDLHVDALGAVARVAPVKHALDDTLAAVEQEDRGGIEGNELAEVLDHAFERLVEGQRLAEVRADLGQRRVLQAALPRFPVETRVGHGGRDVLPQGKGDLQVVLGERPAPLAVDRVEHADELPAPFERNGQNGVGLDAERLFQRPRVARVLARVGDDRRFHTLGHPPDDPLANRYPQAARSLVAPSPGELEHQVLPTLIEEEERNLVGPHRLPHELDDDVEQLVEVERGVEGTTRLHQELELLELRLQFRFGGQRGDFRVPEVCCP
jgi:hypothetical protein